MGSNGRRAGLLEGCGFALLSSLGVSCLWAQTSPAAVTRVQAIAPSASVSSSVDAASSGEVMPPATLEVALQSLFAGAGVVFTGEVTAIEHSPAAVVVRWRVDEAVRGVESGTTFALREWPGLWAEGADRYFLGERALVLMHAPSAAGFLSPVSGGDGIVPLRGDGAGSALDLRLLARRVMDQGRLLPTAARQLPFARAPELGDPAQTASLDGSPASVVDGSSAVDGTLVLGMLHRWQRQRAGR